LRLLYAALSPYTLAFCFFCIYKENRRVLVAKPTVYVFHFATIFDTTSAIIPVLKGFEYCGF